ncbi:MAG: mechanosensitive ion channel domain-containing protein [Bacteroidota bacterium]
MNALNLEVLQYVLGGIVILLVIFLIIYQILKKLGKDPRNILPANFANRIGVPMLVFLASLLIKIAALARLFTYEYTYEVLGSLSSLGFIFSITWFCIIAVKIAKSRILLNYDVTSKDNLSARKIYTQLMILERIIIFLIVILAVGIALMSFENIRSIGISVLTSAGIAGIIIGFSAQKAIGTLLAGIQIAITQPIRMDDVVIVDGEWGRIEEINLTYVVVKIWDHRRLIVPSTYFIENTFQNWTRQSADILGTVFIYTDYEVSFEAIRGELTRLLESSPLWDKKVNVLQVTNATEKAVEIRALMSAIDSGTVWNLRVFIREKLLVFLKENYPESLPKTRIAITDPSKENS